MSYTDAEMLMATQIAYLDFDGDGRQSNQNVGDVVDSILRLYGTYDRTTGSYTMKEGVSGAEKAQFETAQTILKLSENNNVGSWRHWTIVDTCNRQETTGYYGCLIDTGDGSAIVGCRGSESYNLDQAVKDWGLADVGRLNNELTAQQADATAYMKELYERFGDSYERFSFTGHSLGGSLATHAAITAPEGMQDKINNVISYDGPGFSNEYLEANAEKIKRIKDKLNHYEYSWVGNLLFQPDGINNRVIKAHDDRERTDIFRAQLFRHDTKNVEFDSEGNVMEGERGAFQLTIGPVSRDLENSPIPIQVLCLKRYLGLAVTAYIFSVDEQVLQHLDEAVQNIKEKANELCNNYISLVVSGEYEIHTGEMSRMADELESVQRRMDQIAQQVNAVRMSLPYDSVAAYYFKGSLGIQATAIMLEGKKAKKISGVIDKAVVKYNKGDNKTAALF